MEKTESSKAKLWIALGVIAVLSGIGLALSSNYLIGISGSIVGVWLIVQNLNPTQDKDSQ